MEIYSFSLTSSYDSADAAVVLGTSVIRDRPSPVFRERIKHAINLYQAGAVQYIIFTGGQAGNDRLAESEAGRNYAMERGVPQEHIFIETASYNTCLNLIEAKRIIDENDLDQVLIVSDPLHMRRSMWLAEKIGMKALSSPTPTSRYQSLDRKAGFLVREVYSYATYLLNINKCA
ncbi:MAG TPA: YdcF family protein [Anaerolineales bacterium]|jgi:uncharacterized SAM-binding protein YcdF (DUF218 family)|nr:YdcF family protein [Anaerolineales bacterium]